MVRRFHFGLQQILWATFWVAVWGVSFRLFNGAVSPAMMADETVFALLILLVAAPFAGIGALFGRTLKGVALGLVVSAGSIAALLAWVK
jgi:hypothetical protein